MYLTGDYGCQTTAGSIEFLGRRDDQVKVRGYRIELGEIEAALGACAGVRGAAVKAIGDDSPSLVGYITLEAQAAWDEENLKRRLRRSLPEHMIPTQIVVLDAFPMTPSQKIDRSRLPVPEASIRSARRAVELFEQVRAMNSDEVKRVLAGQP
jgi:acyl-coenzyme A synthetase/AMP-(fatty) acid ligase